MLFGILNWIFASDMKVFLFIARKISTFKNKDFNISAPAIKIGIVAVSLGIAVMLLTVSVIKGFKHQIKNKLKSLTSDIIIMPYQSSEDITSRPLMIQKDSLELIRKSHFVKYAEPVCIKNGILKIKEENEGIVFKGVFPNHHWDVLQSYLIEGNFPIYSDTGISKEVVISKKLADKMQIHLNQKIIVYFIVKVENEEGEEKIDYRSRDFYVKGIINPQMGELDNQLIYGDGRIIQKVNSWTSNAYSQIEIFSKEGHSGEEIIENLIDKLPYNYQFVPVEDLYSNVFNWLEMIDVNAVVIIVLMLIVAAVNMVSALIILILEKVNLIGILKALGMNNWNIKNVFLIISLKILGWGLVVGNIIALLFIFLQQNYHIFTLNPDAYYVDYIPVEWNIIDFVLLNIGTIVNCLLFMYIPTILISKLSPSQILRWE
ncbi:MAG: ABC transporter permease [Bacteroidia bacterium]|nr:ABC transporter permease [Bacteroidia bacterium]